MRNPLSYAHEEFHVISYHEEVVALQPSMTRGLLLAAIAIGTVGCGASTSPTPSAAAKPHYGFDAMFVPADAWNNPPGSDGYSGHYVMHNHVPWIPLKIVRELLGDIGIGSAWHQGHLGLTVPAAIPVSLAHLPTPPPTESSQVTVVINGHPVAWVPVWRPSAQAVYVPAVAAIHALRRIKMKMGLAPKKPAGATLTWMVGAPNYRALFSTVRLTKNSSVTSSGMLWVHQGTTWISGNTLDNVLPNGSRVQWFINQHGGIMRLAFTGRHFRGMPVQSALPSGTNIVPIIVNGHRMGSVRWAMAPDNSVYFVLGAVMPVIRSLGPHVMTTPSGIVHWTFNASGQSS